MSKLLWNRFVSMLLAAIMLLSVVPFGAVAEELPVATDDTVVVTDEVAAPAEEPAPALTECEKLQARVDRLLVRYLGGQFDDGVKTDEEILAAVNGMTPGQIAIALAALSDSQFANLWQEITAIKSAAKALGADESASVLKRGQFAFVCEIAQSRQRAQAAQPTATPTPVPTATPVPTEVPEVEVTEEPTVDEPVVDEPVVDEPVVDEPVVEEPASDLAAVTAQLEDVIAKHYREFDGELWVLFETMMALMSPEEMIVCNDDITGVVDAIDALSEEDRAVLLEQYATELGFLVELQAEVAQVLSMPIVTSRAVKSSWVDTSVSNEYFNVIKEDSYKLVSGAEERQIILNNDSGNDRKEVHVFKVDASKVDVLPGYYAFDKFDPNDESTWTAMEVTKTAKYYENTLGYQLIGGMNIALAYDNNKPYSFFVFEHEALVDATKAEKNYHPGCQTYLAIYDDGTCDLRSSSEPLNYNDDGTTEERFAIGANFGWLVKDGNLVTTKVERTSSDASRSMLGILPDGSLMVVHCDGRNGAISSGLSNYEMGELMLSLGCVDAVNGDGGGSSTFISRRPGDADLVMRSTPSDGSERPTLNSVFLAVKGTGGGNVVTEQYDHAEILSAYEYIVPNSVYTLDAVALSNLGNPWEMPEGGVWTLADTTYGSISQEGVFTSNGKLGEVTVCYTVKGVTAEKSINVANPAVARFELPETVLPFGKSTELKLEVFADDAEEFPVYFTSDDFNWTVSDENAGTLDGLTYTATTDEKAKGVVITATYKYATMDALTFTITYGKGSELIGTWNFEDGDVSDWMGFVAAKQWSIANGVKNSLILRDNEHHPGYPDDPGPLGGQFNEQITAYTFLASESNGQVKNGNYSLGWTLDYTDAGFAGWSYNHLFFVGEEHVFRDVLATTPEEDQKPATTFGFWVYIPEGAAGIVNPDDPEKSVQGGLAFMTQFWGTKDGKSYGCYQEHFNFKTASGVVKTLNNAMESDIPASRWVYAYINMGAYQYLSTMDPFTTYQNIRSPSFIRVYIKPMYAQKLTFYFDDMTLDYSSAVDDREQPIIGDIMYATSDDSKALDGETVAASEMVFSANVDDDKTKNNYVGLNTATAQIYVDGVKVATQINGNSMATSEAVVLDNGEHRVTFEIADRMGNVAKKNATFTVAASQDKSLVYLAGHNDSGKTPEYDSVYYVDIMTSDVDAVEAVEANIRLNTANTWELEHMFVAPGFEVEVEELGTDRIYITGKSVGPTVDIDSVENVVHITLTKTDDCTLTGEAKLASLPVRVWSWDGVNNTTGTPITPEEQYKTGYWPIVNIDVDVLYGNVTVDEGDSVTFGGGLFVKTMVNDTNNPLHIHTPAAIEDKSATCEENGYTGRTVCTDAACQSIVEWGELLPATGHSFEIKDDQIICECGKVIGGNGIVAFNGKLYCLIADKLVTGWQMVEGEASGWCYADPTTKEVTVGERTISGIKYTFDERGITAGAWVTNSKGTRYSFGPEFLKREWKEIDGATYYFGTDTYMYTGIRAIAVNRNNIKEGYKVYDFGTDGKMVNDYADYNGIISTDGDGMFFMKDGVSFYGGLMLIDGAYYYARTSGQLVCNATYWPTKTNDLLPAAHYTFGEDGKMINPPVVEPEEPPVDPDPDEPVVPEKKNGIIEEDGKRYWYVDDVKTYGGLMLIDGAYYYARSNGEIVCGKKYWITKNNDLLPVGGYTFGEDGKMIDPPAVEPEEPPVDPDPDEPVVPEKKNGIVEEDGKLYWYVDDVKTYGGLMLIDGAYYYARTSGEIVCNRTYWTTKTNNLLPANSYTFGADGKMIDPPVVE